MNLIKIDFQIQIMVEEIQKIHSQKKVHSEIIKGPEVLQENATLPKSNFVGDATKLVMNLLIAQQNYNQQTGVQDVLKAHIGKTVVGSMSRK